jgi:hypothetical protein
VQLGGEKISKSYQKQAVAINKREFSTQHFNDSRWAHSKFEPDGWEEPRVVVGHLN